MSLISSCSTHSTIGPMKMMGKRKKCVRKMGLLVAGGGTMNYHGSPEQSKCSRRAVDGLATHSGGVYYGGSRYDEVAASVTWSQTTRSQC